MLLFLPIINYLSSFINNCWLGLNSTIKYQTKIEDNVIVGPGKMFIYLNDYNAESFFNDENAVETTMPVIYMDSNNSRSCKRLDEKRRRRRRRRKNR